jgi:hypothetical protein
MKSKVIISALLICGLVFMAAYAMIKRSDAKKREVSNSHQPLPRETGTSRSAVTASLDGKGTGDAVHKSQVQASNPVASPNTNALQQFRLNTNFMASIQTVQGIQTTNRAELAGLIVRAKEVAEECVDLFNRTKPTITEYSGRYTASITRPDGVSSFSYDLGFNGQTILSVHRWSKADSGRRLVSLLHFFPNHGLKLFRLEGDSGAVEFFESGAIKSYFRTSTNGAYYEIVFDEDGRILRQFDK